jgi:class 3 adenylate cyclase/tetratricopeptide (TPR) repeat protein
LKCSKCQFENREGARFCLECGSKLEIICRSCGKSLPPDAKFCDQCGEPSQARKDSPPVDYTRPQSYTPKHLADKILTTRTSIEGERKLITVLFADVANFTSLSSKLDPEEVHTIMEGCFRILMDEIHKYEGTINQFTGDGIMALFGAPVAHEDHAQRACHASLAIQKAMQGYGEKVEKDYRVEFRMRMGLNSGPVIVGAIGDDLRMDYTAVGDTTNLASRMESLAQPGSVLVSKNIHRLVKDYFELKPLGKLEVKGKEEPQDAFELVKPSKVATRIGASVAKGLTRFVGRRNSMAALTDAFDKVKSSSGQVVGIVGEAGVGKSRLLLEMRNVLPQDEYSYLEGRCIHFGGSMAYLPLLDILRTFFEIKEEDRESIIKKKMEEKILDLDEKIKGVLPPFQELLSLKVDDEEFRKLEPKEKRARTFEAIRDLMIRISQEKPLVLAVEDLHWMDKTSEEFLDYLVDWLANTPILLIALYRPEYTHQWGSKSYYTKIGVDQLGTESSAELVQAILEGDEMAPELEKLILNRAAGNPLFMEEFTHTLLENGSIERKDNQYILTRKASDIQVPDTIQGIIAARMDRLEDNLKRTMQVASVIGRDFAFSILQTITGMREELKTYLLNLQRLEFIYEKQLFPELEYIFKHSLTQEVAYNTLLLRRRKEIHENIGRAIESLYAERLEEFYEIMSYHFSNSGNTEKAYRYLRLSGEKAMGSYANTEALRLYKETLNVLDHQPDGEEKKRKELEIIRSMIPPMFYLMWPKDSLQILEKGERLSKEFGNARGLAEIYNAIALYYYNFRGDPLKATEYTENSFEQARKIEDIDLMAESAFGLCGSYWASGELSKIVDVASEVIRLLEKTGKKSELFSGFPLYEILHSYWGASTAWMGNFDEAEELLKKGLQHSLKVDDLSPLAILELHYGSLYNLKGEGQKAIEHAQNCIKICEEGQFVNVLGIAWWMSGWGYLLLGELETAKNHIEKGFKIHSDAGRKSWVSGFYGTISMIHFDSGNLPDAKKWAEKSIDFAVKHNEKASEGCSRIWLGRILAKADISKRGEAEKCIRQGMKILDECRIRPFLTQGHLFLGELYVAAGQTERALEHLEKARNGFQEMGMDYWLAKTQEVLAGL